MSSTMEQNWRRLQAWPVNAAGYIAGHWERVHQRLGRRARLLAWLVAMHLLLMAADVTPPLGAMAGLLITFALTAAIPLAEEFAPAPPAVQSPWSGAWWPLLDAIPDPALVLDGSFIVLHHNPAVSDLYPRVRHGVPLTHLTRSPELIEAVENAVLREERIVVELKDRVPVTRNIAAIVTRIGMPAEAVGDIAPETGRPAIMVVFRDVTDQEKLAQMRADFIANASHELRTPLASLRGFVETLQGPARDDPASRERFLAIMATQASRMTRLIDDLLTLSRAEMRVHVPPRGVVDLGDVLLFVTQSLEPLAQGNETSIALSVPPGPIAVRGERDELVQVFQNLVQNAIKYGRSGGQVEVTLGREPAGAGHGPRLVVSVKDNGPGISEEHIPRLTERFYRVNVNQSREKGGTGLGLAIVKYVVSRHRGELRISSELGVGSTFSVILDELSPR